MDQLVRLSCVPDIWDYLGKLPKDLKTAYDEIMQRVKEQEGRPPKIAHRAFLWVMCSSRPLKTWELEAAVCQDPETEATNPDCIDIGFILAACHNLLMIDQSNNCRFSHLSVQEYLESHQYNDGKHIP
jgi:hypothetical protein